MNTSSIMLIVCGFIAAMSLPLILRWVPPNRVYGFRTRKTLSDPKIWFRANSFAGWAMFIAAVVAAGLISVPVELVHGPLSGVVDLVVPLTIAVIACGLYLRGLGGSGG